MDDYAHTTMMKAPETLKTENQTTSRIPLTTIAICGIIVGGLVLILLFFYLLSRIRAKYRSYKAREHGSAKDFSPSLLEAGEKQGFKDEEMDGGELENWLRRRSLGRFSDMGSNPYGSFNRTPFEDWPSVRSRTNLYEPSDLKSNHGTHQPSRPAPPPLNPLFAPSMSSDCTRVNYSTQPHDIKPGLPKIFLASQYSCLRSVSNPGPRHERWQRDRTMHRRPRCRPRSNSLGSNFVPIHPFLQSDSGLKVPAPPSKALTADGVRAGWDTPSWVPANYYS